MTWPQRQGEKLTNPYKSRSRSWTEDHSLYENSLYLQLPKTRRLSGGKCCHSKTMTKLPHTYTYICGAIEEPRGGTEKQTRMSKGLCSHSCQAERPSVWTSWAWHQPIQRYHGTKGLDYQVPRTCRWCVYYVFSSTHTQRHAISLLVALMLLVVVFFHFSKWERRPIIRPRKKSTTHTHTHLQARFDVYMSMCVSRRRIALVSLYTLKTFEVQNMFRYKICSSMCVSAGVLLWLLNKALHRNKNT